MTARDKLIRAQQLLADAAPALALLDEIHASMGGGDRSLLREKVTALLDRSKRRADELAQHKQLLETVKVERDRHATDAHAADCLMNQVKHALVGHCELPDNELVDALKELKTEHAAMRNRDTSLRQRLMTALGGSVLDDDALVDLVTLGGGQWPYRIAGVYPDGHRRLQSIDTPLYKPE